MKQNFYAERFKKNVNGLNHEFKVILDNSKYIGPVLFIDLRRKSLGDLGIYTKKISELLALFADYACAYQQMNTFILLDQKENSRLYSSYEVCRILSAKPGDDRFDWMAVFSGSEVREVVYQTNNAEHPAEKFSCLHLRNIPDFFMKFNEQIWGVENYLPHIMFFLLENISNGLIPNATYPFMYKNEGILPYAPKTVLWHRLVKID